MQVTAAPSHVPRSTAQPGTPRALSRRRDRGRWTGACCLVLSQVSESPGNSGGELATGSLFSGSFSKRRKQKFLPTGSFSFSPLWRPVRSGRESPQSCQATPAGLLVFFFFFCVCPFFFSPAPGSRRSSGCARGRKGARRGGTEGRADFFRGRDPVDNRFRGACRAETKCGAWRSGGHFPSVAASLSASVRGQPRSQEPSPRRGRWTSERAADCARPRRGRGRKPPCFLSGPHRGSCTRIIPGTLTPRPGAAAALLRTPSPTPAVAAASRYVRARVHLAARADSCPLFSLPTASTPNLCLYPFLTGLEKYFGGHRG